MMDLPFKCISNNCICYNAPCFLIWILEYFKCMDSKLTKRESKSVSLNIDLLIWINIANLGIYFPFSKSLLIPRYLTLEYLLIPSICYIVFLVLNIVLAHLSGYWTIAVVIKFLLQQILNFPIQNCFNFTFKPASF